MEADQPNAGIADEGRCLAVVGTAFSGPMYCGFQAKAADANGRPCCGRHLGRMLGIDWFGKRGRYPFGTDGTWRFWNGAESRG